MRQFFKKVNMDFFPISFNIFKVIFVEADASYEKWPKEEKDILSIYFLVMVWKVAKEWIWTLKIIGSQNYLPVPKNVLDFAEKNQ